MTSHLRINTNIDEWGNLHPPISPWPSPTRDKEAAALAFEVASIKLDDIIAKHHQAEKPTEDCINLNWLKDAPGSEYTGKRTKKGMPDKRTKEGKEWYASVMV
mgnify:CR=1 FL=1